MGKTMLAGRKIRVRVYRSIRSKTYKLVANGHVMFVAPDVVKTKEGEIVAVGSYAKTFYDAIALRNTNLLRQAMQNALYILNL
jgi:hypothetical protein